MDLKTKLLTIALLLMSSASIAQEPLPMVAISGGSFIPLFRNGPESGDSLPVTVLPFALDAAPVTNAQFAKFIAANPQWDRANVSALLADSRYLQHWLNAAQPVAALHFRPVVNVSWHAAKAYCKWRGYRLPTDYEWQFAAYEGAEDYSALLVKWYSKPASEELSEVMTGSANRFHLFDMYGPVWEWVGDFSTLMMGSDSRTSGGANAVEFCGAGAQSATESRNYIGFMRAAYLSALQPHYTTTSLGFRCASDVKGGA